MLVLQVNLVVLVLFGAYLAGYLGPSKPEFPQGFIPPAELDARFEALSAQNAKLEQGLQQLERRNRSGTTRRAAPIPIDVPIPIARPPRAPEPPDEQQGDLAPEAGDPAPGPMITSNLGFLVVAGLTSVLYVGIVSALLTPA